MFQIFCQCESFWCTGAFVLSHSILQAVMTIFYCTPVEALWDHRIEAKYIDLDDALIVFHLSILERMS